MVSWEYASYSCSEQLPLARDDSKLSYISLTALTHSTNLSNSPLQNNNYIRSSLAAGSLSSSQAPYDPSAYYSRAPGSYSSHARASQSMGPGAGTGGALYSVKYLGIVDGAMGILSRKMPLAAN